MPPREVDSETNDRSNNYSPREGAHMKPIRMFASAIAAAAFAFAPIRVGAQVLQQVPADALVVIKFNKLKATSDKLAALSNKLGIAQMNPDMADPLGKLQEQAGVKEGVDPNGDA